MRCDFVIPMLPPSVNAYVRHPAAGVHIKSPAAKAWERDWPLFSRGMYVVSTSGRFAVTLEFTPGPSDKGDVDNRNKCVLDCIARAGMLRDKKGKNCSDAWIKKLTVEIHDTDEDRKQGPRTVVRIEEYA